MNCKQLNTIPIYQVLEYYGFQPKKSNSHKIWYLNPFGQENTPSFEVQIKTNTWSLYSESTKRRTVVDFLLRKENKTLSELLQWAENQKFSNYFSSSKQNLSEHIIFRSNNEINYEITNITSIKYSVLVDYLKDRKLENFIRDFKQVFYKMNESKYFGLGWINDSGFWEVSYRIKDHEHPHLFKTQKRCLGKKDISTIYNRGNTLCIFEGYFDMLAYRNTFGKYKTDEDYLILNSTSMVDLIKDKLIGYEDIQLYLDNDKAGDEATNFILSLGCNITDMRNLYRHVKDVNDYLIHL